MKSNSKNELQIGLQDVADFLGLEANEGTEFHQKLKSFAGKKIIRAGQSRSILQDFGFKFPQKTISFQMLKGGVAKTTSAFNLGLRAAQYGARVLFVDLDQQANLTFALGRENEMDPAWIDIVEKKVTVFESIKNVAPGIDLIPSNLNNSVLDRVLLNSQRQWALLIKRPLEQIRENYDLIVIDTAPALSAVNTAVTVASDLVILPVVPDRFSYLGLQKHIKELDEIKADFGLQFEAQVLVTKFDQRERSSHEVMERCLQEFSEKMLKSFVRNCAEIKNNLGADPFLDSKSITNDPISRSIFSRQSSAKEDYDLVAREILGGFHA